MKPPCVILAGGRSSRMGGNDKSLLPFRGKPLLAHVLDAIVPQTGAVLINANGNPARFADFGLPVRADAIPGFQGPLAGLLTGMLWARRYHPHAKHILSVSCDTPFLPGTLATELEKARHREKAEIAIARDPARAHPTIGLWPVVLAERLDTDLRRTDCRALFGWLSWFAVAETCFAAECFRNINTPQDLTEAGATDTPESVANDRGSTRMTI